MRADCGVLCCAVLCCVVLCGAAMCCDVLCCAMLCLGYMLDDNMHSYIYRKAHNTQVIAGDPEINPQFVGSALTAAATLLSQINGKKGSSKGRSHRAFFFRIYSFFFQRKQERKQEISPKFGNLTEGKMCGTLSIPILEKKGKSGNKTKNTRFCVWKFRTRVLR